jgi:hypothetical protein
MTMNRFEQAAIERRGVANRLATEYLPDLPAEVADHVFGLAYEQGHSSGWTEVEHYYAEIAPVVVAAFSAGQESAS